MADQRDKRVVGIFVLVTALLCVGAAVAIVLALPRTVLSKLEVGGRTFEFRRETDFNNPNPRFMVRCQSPGSEPTYTSVGSVAAKLLSEKAVLVAFGERYVLLVEYPGSKTCHFIHDATTGRTWCQVGGGAAELKAELKAQPDGEKWVFK